MLSPRTPSHQYIPGRMISRGNYFPRSSCPPGISSHLYFTHVAVITLYSHPFIDPSEMRDHENLQNKIRKVPPAAGCQLRSIPLNAARKGRELSWQCSIFEGRIASSPLAPDRVPFLGTCGSPSLHSGSPLRIAIGGCRIHRGLSPQRYILY